tara:strand:- start:347 stop:850 length:504 start_codon:yes stop_codon:yes gene_type:complete
MSSTPKFVNIKELIDKQIVDGYFNRVDIIVRYMYIEFFFGQTHKVDPYKLYKKMCTRRLGHTEHADSEDKVMTFVMSYNSLIESVYQNGFYHNSSILLNNESDKKLIDGSHRIAVGLYFGLEELPVEYDNSDRLYKFGFDWFEKNNFSKIERSEIESCYGRALGDLY